MPGDRESNDSPAPTSCRFRHARLLAQIRASRRTCPAVAALVSNLLSSSTDVAMAAGTILVIDDDPEMRAVLKEFLERDGHRVVERANCERLPEIVKTARPDAVILDKELPGMNGLDALAFLRLHCPDIPVILITAFGGSAVAEEAFRRGATRYVEKPFRLTDLVVVVRALLAARSA